MLGSTSKFVFHVWSSNDVACVIAEEVERLYGFGIGIVSLGPGSESSLYIDSRFPTWEQAFAYARELYAAARESREAYRAAIR